MKKKRCKIIVERDWFYLAIASVFSLVILAVDDIFWIYYYYSSTTPEDILLFPITSIIIFLVGLILSLFSKEIYVEEIKK